jgi:hypothetical protein
MKFHILVNIPKLLFSVTHVGGGKPISFLQKEESLAVGRFILNRKTTFQFALFDHLLARFAFPNWTLKSIQAAQPQDLLATWRGY